MHQILQKTNYRMGVATITVSNMGISRGFYEDILGFTVGTYYEPTNWIAYSMDNQVLFAIQEMTGFQRQCSCDMLDFYLEDIDLLWDSIKDRCTVINPLGRTPWGSYKFVIQDPDGIMLGFVKKEE